VYKHGNHDEPRFSHGKDAIPLAIFDSSLRGAVASGIAEFLANNGIKWISPGGFIAKLVNEKIVRVGESRIANISGVPVGVKHPFQARTISKGLRVQQTANFFLEALKNWPDVSAKSLSVVHVANFHEAAAIFTAVFGRTIFGVMTGAQIYDSQFESNQNKVVDYGLAKTRVVLNKVGQILSARVEYFDDIVEEDKEIVFKDNLSEADVADLHLRLASKYDMPWR
jgi:hypothetical protein